MSKLFFLSPPDYVKADVEAEQSRIRKVNKIYDALSTIETHIEELDSDEFQ